MRVVQLHTHEPDGLTLYVDDEPITRVSTSEVGALLRALGAELGFTVHETSDEDED